MTTAAHLTHIALNWLTSATFIGIIGIMRQGDKIGPYKIVRWINAGSFASVWEATSGTGIHVALKIMSFPATSDKFDQNRAGEIEVLSQMNHDNIIQIYESFDHDGFPVLALELAGSDAEQISTPSLSTALDIAIGIGQALAYMHKAAVIHRDVKPANILKVGPTWKLGDFTFAKTYNRSLVTHSTIGTLAYLSPEQLSERPQVGPRSDVWALATSVYRVITGRLPYHGGMPVPGDVRLETDGMPTWLHNLFLDCFSQNQRDRPDAETFYKTIQRNMPPRTVPAQTIRPVPPIPQTPSAQLSPIPVPDWNTRQPSQLFDILTFSSRHGFKQKVFIKFNARAYWTPVAEFLGPGNQLIDVEPFGTQPIFRSGAIMTQYPFYFAADRDLDGALTPNPNAIELGDFPYHCTSIRDIRATTAEPCEVASTTHQLQLQRRPKSGDWLFLPCGTITPKDEPRIERLDRKIEMVRYFPNQKSIRMLTIQWIDEAIHIKS